MRAAQVPHVRRARPGLHRRGEQPAGQIVLNYVSYTCNIRPMDPGHRWRCVLEHQERRGIRLVMATQRRVPESVTFCQVLSCGAATRTPATSTRVPLITLAFDVAGTRIPNPPAGRSWFGCARRKSHSESGREPVLRASQVDPLAPPRVCYVNGIAERLTAGRRGAGGGVSESPNPAWGRTNSCSDLPRRL